MNFVKYFLFFFLIFPNLLLANGDKTAYWEVLFAKGELGKLEQSVSSELSHSGGNHLTKKEHMRALVYMCWVRRNENNYQEALEYLIRAKQLNPKNLDKYAVLYSADFAYFFDEIGGLNLAIYYYKECLRLHPDRGMKYHYLGSIGSCYLKTNDHQKAIDYFTRQNKLAIQMNQVIPVSSSYNNLGIAYYKQKDFHKAKTNYLKSLSNLTRNKDRYNKNTPDYDEGFYYTLLSNLGITCYELGQYNEAATFLTKAFGEDRIKYSLTYPAENIKTEVTLVSCLLKIGNLAEAQGIVNQFEAHKSGMSPEKRLQFIDMKAEVFLNNKQYDLLKQLLQERRKVAEQAETEKKVKQSALSNLVSQYMIASNALQLKQEKMQKEQFRKDKEIQENKTFIVTVLWVVSCSTFILMLVIIYQIGKTRQRKYQLEKERKAIEDERIQLKLKAQENSLTDLAMEVVQKRETSDGLIQKISAVLKEADEKTKTELIGILREVKMNRQNGTSVASEDPDALIHMKEFQQRLLIINPDLSKSEIELSTLVRMNLSNKEIATVKNCAEGTIKTAKNRLKKKLSLDSDDSLTKFIREV